MNRIFLLSLIILFASCTPQDSSPEPQNLDEVKADIWAAIEERHYTWRDNDYEGHMATYHPDWQRWNLKADKLLTKDDFVGLWDYMKERERCLEMELNPIEIKLLSDEVAMVHLTSLETFEWISLDTIGEKVPGAVFQAKLRWSDVLVKEGDDWLVIGGHRDRSASDFETIRLN